MKTLSLAEAKTQLSAILKDVATGNEIIISYGKKRENIAVIVPYEAWKKSKIRQLGTLQTKGSIAFSQDFAITDEDIAIL